ESGAHQDATATNPAKDAKQTAIDLINSILQDNPAFDAPPFVKEICKMAPDLNTSNAPATGKTAVGAGTNEGKSPDFAGWPLRAVVYAISDDGMAALEDGTTTVHEVATGKTQDDGVSATLKILLEKVDDIVEMADEFGEVHVLVIVIWHKSMMENEEVRELVEKTIEFMKVLLSSRAEDVKLKENIQKCLETVISCLSFCYKYTMTKQEFNSLKDWLEPLYNEMEEQQKVLMKSYVK
ncbi:hypothetical protein HK405_009688, partial [Cladochytrium tenue]